MKNASIKVKVFLPIIVLSILLCLACGVSVRNVNSMMASSTRISENYSANTIKILQISQNYKSIQRIIYAHCLAGSNGSMQTLKEEYNTLKNTNNTLIAELEETVTPGEEADTFARFKEDYASFIESYESALTLSTSKETDKAVQLANSTITTMGNVVSQDIDDIVTYNQESLDAAILSQQETSQMSVVAAVIIMVIAALAVGLAVVICAREIVKPLLKTNKQLNKIIRDIQENNGDLTARVTVTGKDEIGQLGRGINTFIETLQNIMKKITNNSMRLDDVVGAVSHSVSVANENSVDISAVMGQLASSMGQVADTVSSVNNNTSNVDGDIDELAQASADLLRYAEEMHTRASNLENTAVSNKQNTGEVIDEILSSLKLAIEESKSIDRVNELTDEILSISSKTNLLALNASIEAARAGDAGKGFAVVAEEIRLLADSSRQTANNIQEINNMVTLAVKELIKNANTIVDYINERILPDYDNFVDSGRQYNEDAVHVNDSVTRFNEMFSNLRQLVVAITESITGISVAVEESANGVSAVAVNTSDLVKGITAISGEMQNNSRIAGELKQEADIFVRL
jgi:methyl-accepting chemotaxis protein